MIRVTDIVDATHNNKEFDFVISLLDPRMAQLDKKDISEEFKRDHGKNHIIYFFEDSVHKEDGPSYQDIKGIFDDYERYGMKDKDVLVHCHAGISRSTAVTIGLLMKFHGMSIEEAFKHTYMIRNVMHPNSLILEHVDAMLGLDGALSDYYSSWMFQRRNKLTWQE